jgi:hypothetical protein
VTSNLSYVFFPDKVSKRKFVLGQPAASPIPKMLRQHFQVSRSLVSIFFFFNPRFEIFSTHDFNVEICNCSNRLKTWKKVVVFFSSILSELTDKV